jgi:hypothetical protein
MFSVLMWISAHGSASLAIPDRANPFEAPIVGPPPHASGSVEVDEDDERPIPV